jgi:Uma2 family endonuclease
VPLQVVLRSGRVDHPCLVKVDGFTEDQYDAITNEDTAFELLDGFLIMHSPASIEHEVTFAFLLRLLGDYVELHELGRVLGSRAVLHLRKGRKVEPDLMFLSRQREVSRRQKEIDGTADLVVELLSGSTRAYDLGEKRLAYKQARTPELWFGAAGSGRLILVAWMIVARRSASHLASPEGNLELDVGVQAYPPLVIGAVGRPPRGRPIARGDQRPEVQADLVPELMVGSEDVTAMVRLEEEIVLREG